ncbi:MAG: ATP-binding cassette domain-containing protein, partial [Holophagales bacterium]|nr:ATP-binding cassette domain-containing protein [Holophagales bacterium]
MSPGPFALELSGVAKSFGAVRALDGARIAIRPGEIHALLGENGAGKSTLVAIAAGFLRADAGEVRCDG